MTRAIAAAASPDRRAVTDGTMVFAYFGPEGLYAYDFAGRLAWKVVESSRRSASAPARRRCSFENLVIIQRDEDNGDNSVDRRLRQEDRQGSLEDEAAGPNQLGRRRCS